MAYQELYIRQNNQTNTSNTLVLDDSLLYQFYPGGIFQLEWNIIVQTSGLLPGYTWNVITEKNTTTFDNIVISSEIIKYGDVSSVVSLGLTLNNNVVLSALPSTLSLRILVTAANASDNDVIGLQFACNSGTSVTHLAGSTLRVLRYN